ncbi:KilA-N domain-containing protein [Glaesserella parasuis]|uniref:KilA-N domain-containing protein n=1 Tax=Glaesserella parasuis TaxID=738 RepID=A0AA42JHM0_GLAPU|nr:KilA-N domain-containing protein [Glaesserella parasuis]MDP0310219.1 KilA-N domain-containing protein [Glaesserella parasuis]MDP0329673.1 KilA-N domain-containing protein [Glaesserella parasuis]MDP0393158.1 KilA-N domain-containing protein [Glaesserella parasuis]MDP0454180.1 KilA-N domain-containing protein [Glaesserella parasuis]
MSTQLTILKTSIRTFENLYSLNDLHLASGGEDKHRPTFFIRLDTTKDLVKEIESENSDVQICTSIKSLRTGVNKGTWACEELALAYATWVSPKFHLVVLRAFIAMHKGGLQNSTQIVPLEPKPDVVLPHEKAEQIAKYLVRARAFAKEVEVFHRKLYEDLGISRYVKNDIAGKAYDIAHEFNVWLDPFIEQALPQLNQQRLARF